MAPEVLSRTNMDAGPGIDVWALGCMLYAMVLGTMPFSGETEDEIAHAIMKKKVTFKTEKVTSKEFRDLVQKILTKDPEERINMYDLQNHPWMEMSDDDLEESIEKGKQADDEEEKKKEEEDDAEYLAKLSLSDAKAQSLKPNFDPNNLSMNKNKKNLSPKASSPSFSKGTSGSLNGSLKKKSKPVKKKKKTSK